MILTIDIGNSTITLGGVQGDEIRFECRINTDRVKTSDTYCIDLKTLFEIYGVELGTIEGVIIASVVPQVLNSVRTAIRKLLGTEPLVVGPGLKTGLNIKLENPGQMGADLVAAGVAALREHKPPLVIIDMGPATTMSVLDPEGAHLGGCVCPGLRISLEALTGRTSLLPGIQLDSPRQAIGRNTADAMRSGVMYGTAAMLDGMIDRFREETGWDFTVVATGGLAKRVVPLCRHRIVYDRHLIIKGLAALYRDNAV
ncbi:MAG: type III pantothenate kinase [Oscillospiraceae bacterium]|nr:type III pantothenate kinase [Oscillospiraceae bacterium]